VEIGSLFQVVMVLVVFACTGLQFFFNQNPHLDFSVWKKGVFCNTLCTYLLYFRFIKFLLIYGFIFGSFNFSGNRKADFFRRIAQVFK